MMHPSKICKLLRQLSEDFNGNQGRDGLDMHVQTVTQFESKRPQLPASITAPIRIFKLMRLNTNSCLNSNHIPFPKNNYKGDYFLGILIALLSALQFV